MVTTTDSIHGGGGGIKNPKQGNGMIEGRPKNTKKPPVQTVGKVKKK